MLERDYQEWMEQVKPSPALREQTAKRMAELGKSRAVRPRGRKRLAAAVLACVLVTALSATALAAAFPDFREVLFGKDSPVAEFVTPVASAMGEEDGIRLEVLGAMSDKNNVIAYFTLQDTKGENRLSRDMYLNVYAKLNGEYPVDAAAELLQGAGKHDYTSVLDYDPETQTVFCRYEMTISGDYDATGASVQLWLERIWQDKQDYALPQLSSAPLTTETLPVAYSQAWVTVPDGSGGHMEKDGLLTVEQALEGAEEIINGEEAVLYGDFSGNYDETGKPVVLKPGEPILESEDGSIAITAVGFIDGKLHIQRREQAWSDGEAGGLFNTSSVYLAPLGEGEKLAEQLNAHQIGRYVDPELMEKLDHARLCPSNSFVVDESGQVIWNENAAIDAGKTYYTESIFNIGPAEELADYDCVVRFSETRAQKMELRTEDFSTAGELSRSAVSCKNLTADGITIDALDITALGVYATGLNSDMRKIKTLELVCGGESFPYSISYNYNYEQEAMSFTMKFISEGAPVEPENVTAVRINGEEIPLQ